MKTRRSRSDCSESPWRPYGRLRGRSWLGQEECRNYTHYGTWRKGREQPTALAKKTDPENIQSTQLSQKNNERKRTITQEERTPYDD
jgi:hypothetical protein